MWEACLAQAVLVDGNPVAIGEDGLDLRLHVGQVVVGQQGKNGSREGSGNTHDKFHLKAVSEEFYAGGAGSAMEPRNLLRATATGFGEVQENNPASSRA
jgi:hypothetical protein